jgi:hypothetical protein
MGFSRISVARLLTEGIWRKTKEEERGGEEEGEEVEEAGSGGEDVDVAEDQAQEQTRPVGSVNTIQAVTSRRLPFNDDEGVWASRALFTSRYGANTCGQLWMANSSVQPGSWLRNAQLTSPLTSSQRCGMMQDTT